MNIITKSEDEAKGIAGESMHQKKVSPAIWSALSLYLDKGYEFEVQKGTLDIKYPQKNHTKYSSLHSIKPGASESAHTLIPPGEVMGYKPRAG